jgi:hypothetical protein
MATTVGALAYGGVGGDQTLICPAATAGTPPYTYQWYRSTTSGFTPGAGNILVGATGLVLTDVPPLSDTIYFYVCVATDSGAVAGNSPQFAVNSGNQIRASVQMDIMQAGDTTKTVYGFGSGMASSNH